MTTPAPTAALAERFALSAAVIALAPLGRGLINDTFRVTLADGTHAVLQRINRRAFPEPQRIMQNLRALEEHTRQQPTPLRLPQIVRTRDGGDYVLDECGEFWRMLSYIEHSYTATTLSDTAQAESLGRALGEFHALVSTLDPARLHATRPGFHNTPRYLARFDEVARATTPERITDAVRECFDFIDTHRALAPILEDAKERGLLPLRAIHGDPKLDNFLFDEATHGAVSLIDLDTLQPGLTQYDLGDCLRSCCNPAGESPAEIDSVRFDLALCEAILRGYLTASRASLSAADRGFFYDAIRLIPFELGLRFLTDHLEGNVYFKVSDPEQNLHRARVQFRLVREIETAHADIHALIQALSSHGGA
jgi:Ser/Thr protein kinase RdoA (MazF antagonist)